MSQDIRRNKDVFHPSSKPYGVTYGQWTVRWWRWLISIPMCINPAADYTGANAGINQPYSDVWFLAGTFGGKTVNRKCNMPSCKSILFPVINYEMNEIEKPEMTTSSDLIKHVTEDEDDIINLEATIDGESVPIYRVKSDPELFPLTIPEDNPFNVSGGIDTIAVADGYWVFLKPLSGGEHNLYFAGSCSAGTRNVTAKYSLNLS